MTVTDGAESASIAQNGKAVFPQNNSDKDWVYKITYTDSNGCQAEKEYTIRNCYVPPTPATTCSVVSPCVWALPVDGLTVNVSNPINGGEILFDIISYKENGEEDILYQNGSITMTNQTSYSGVAIGEWGKVSDRNVFKWHLRSDSSVSGSVTFSINVCENTYRTFASWEESSEISPALKSVLEYPNRVVWIAYTNSLDYNGSLTLNSYVEKYNNNEWEHFGDGKYKLDSTRVCWNYEYYTFGEGDCNYGSLNKESKTDFDSKDEGKEYKLVISGGLVTLRQNTEDYAKGNISIDFNMTSFDEPSVGVQDLKIEITIEFDNGTMANIEFEWGEKYCSNNDVNCNCLEEMNSAGKLPSKECMGWDDASWKYINGCNY